MNENEVSIFGKEIKIGEKAIRINGRKIKMGEKVVITSEQADDVERLKELYEHYSDGYRNLQLIQEKLNGSYQREDEDIKEANMIPDSEFIKLLHYGYEVEEPYKVGDWVVHLGSVTAKIEYIDGSGIIHIDIACINTFPRHFRHATESEIAEEKERRKWRRVDREVGEHKAGDIVKLEGKRFEEVNYVNALGDAEVKNLMIVYSSNECELICFVEDRKDEGCIDEQGSTNN